QVGWELLVIPGDGRVGREEEDVGQVVAAGEARRLEVQDGRDEDDAVEGDAVLDEVAGKPRRARRPVTLADEEERRSPALVARQVEADELADRLEVALESEILAPQLRLRRAAVARAHRVYEDEV